MIIRLSSAVELTGNFFGRHKRSVQCRAATSQFKISSCRDGNYVWIITFLSFRGRQIADVDNRIAAIARWLCARLSIFQRGKYRCLDAVRDVAHPADILVPKNLRFRATAFGHDQSERLLGGTWTRADVAVSRAGDQLCERFGSKDNGNSRQQSLSGQEGGGLRYLSLAGRRADEMQFEGMAFAMHLVRNHQERASWCL